MKKLCVLVLVAGLVAACAMGAEVKSGNGVGVTRVAVVSNFNFLAYNWTQIGGVTKTSVQDLLDPSQLVKGASTAFVEPNTTPRVLKVAAPVMVDGRVSVSPLMLLVMTRPA